MRKFSTLAILAVAMLFTACKKEQNRDTGDTFTDSRDGQKYRIVKMGNLIWTAENINFQTDQNWCYDNDCKKYGRLYPWDNAMVACPANWRLPTHEDWISLFQYVGGDPGKKLKSKADWNGDDNFGFSALPGGFYDSFGGSIRDVGTLSKWWSATEHNANDAYYWQVVQYNSIMNSNSTKKRHAFSVRCVMGEASPVAAEEYIEEFQGDAYEEEVCNEPIHECADIPSEGDIVVKTAAEFLCAIGSNRNLLLEEGVYNITNNNCALRNISNEHVNWVGGGALRINNVHNMSIRGMRNKPSELLTDNRNVFVMTFYDSKNLSIKNVTIGHSEGTDECGAGVLYFNNCSNIKIDKTNMYGSGTIGLDIDKVTDMEVTNSTIYECVHSIMDLADSKDISFKNCLFRDNYGMVRIFRNVSNVVFDECEFRNNKGSDAFEIQGGEPNTAKDILIKNTKFVGNEASALTRFEVFNFEGCTFEGNTFSDTP